MTQAHQTRREFLKVIGVGAVALAAGSRLSRGNEKERPNLLFILTDDQRWDTIRALGNPEIHTPNLDRLVTQGFHFKNAYGMGAMVGAVCLPSRTMLATGRSLWHIPPNPRAKTAPEGVPLLLKEAGYDTFHSGKAGNACTFSNAAFHTNIETRNRDANSATEHANNVIKFLRTYDGAKPFFIYLAPPVPHDPRLAPPEFVKLYDPAKITLSKNFMAEHPFDNGELKIRDEVLAAHPRTPAEMRRHLADYYATISHLDHEVGRILGVVKERGWMENTVVIFSSDQGLAVGGRHGLMGKQNLYEHVKPPLIFAGPGIPHGQSDALVYLYDLFPTLCELAGAKTPAVVEGRSLLPVVLGRQTYGDSFTQCHQVSDGETWQEYLAGHLGEPVRNFGMGGYGVYQAYRRMVREERTDHGAPYVIFYIWGDDHIRSLLRCRHAIILRWWDDQGGRAFHNNFWPNIEMDLQTGQFVEKENLLPTREALYQMTDPQRMVDLLKDDLALQLFAFKLGLIRDVDRKPISELAARLDFPIDWSQDATLRSQADRLLDRYSLRATRFVLEKAREFARQNGKRLLVVLFDPGRVLPQLVEGQARYDQEIVDFLRENGFTYFDMNVVHVEDFKCFRLTYSSIDSAISSGITIRAAITSSPTRSRIRWSNGSIRSRLPTRSSTRNRSISKDTCRILTDRRK